MEIESHNQQPDQVSDSQYVITVPDVLYMGWRTIGALEGCDTDEEIVRYFVNLYHSLRWKDKEECSIKCSLCHHPLILYCNTCQCPSHLASSTQPLPPPLSSSPPVPSSQVSDISTGSSVPTCRSAADVERSDAPVSQISEVKDEEEDSADLLQNVEGYDSDVRCDVDIDKTTSGYNQNLQSPESDFNFGTKLCVKVNQRKTGRTKLTTDPVISFSSHKGKRTQDRPTTSNTTEHVTSSRPTTPNTAEPVTSSDQMKNTTSSTTEPITSSDHRNKTKFTTSGSTDPVDSSDKGTRIENTTSSTSVPDDILVLLRQYYSAVQADKSPDWQKSALPSDQRMHPNKTRKRKLRITKQTTRNTMLTDSIVQTTKRARRHLRPQDAIRNFSEQDWNSPGINRSSKQDTNSPGRVEEGLNDQAQEKPSAEQKKRKPRDLKKDTKEGVIIPADERQLAQMIVCDESFLKRHMAKDVSSRRRRTSVSPLKEHGRQLTQTVDEFDYRSDPDASETCLSQEHGASHPSERNRTDSRILEDAGGTESGESEDANKLPFTILVSAIKIPPLRTADGSYMRTSFSYYECDHCKAAFVSKRTFNQHITSHTNQNVYKCGWCENEYKSALELKQHEKVHAKSECSVCGQKYTDKNEFSEHMKLHTENGGVMKCPGCEYRSKDFHKYRKHKYDCAYLRPALQCEMCGAHLKSSKALKHHVAAIHNNDRPFKCHLCDKSFVFQTKLKSHLTYMHAEGGKSFHCDKCGQRFHEPKGLKSHQKSVHSDEKPFKCTYCPMAFVRNHTLTVHIRKHTGEKPYQCSNCLQAFAQLTSLKLHLKNHHVAASGKQMDKVLHY